MSCVWYIIHNLTLSFDYNRICTESEKYLSLSFDNIVIWCQCHILNMSSENVWLIAKFSLHIVILTTSNSVSVVKQCAYVLGCIYANKHQRVKILTRFVTNKWSIMKLESDFISIENWCQCVEITAPLLTSVWNVLCCLLPGL